MADAQNNDAFSLDPIARHVGPHRRHLAPSVSDNAATFGKFGKVVGDCNQALAKARGSVRIERSEISDDGFEVTDRLVGPDDPL